VRLHFYREEDTACSETVLFPDLGRSAHLTPFQDTVVELTPPEPGEYGFQCGMGMLRGRLVAE
jgi:Cu+-exporting ATPase